MRRRDYAAGVALAAIVVLAASPVLAANFDPLAATDAYLKSLPAAARAKSDAYFEGGYWLILWNALWTIGALVLLLATGLSARMRDLAVRVSRVRFVQVAIYAVLFTLITALLSLPLDIYQQFVREHAYNLSNQNFGSWLSDDLIGLAISVVTSAIALPVIYAVIRAAPRLWWLWGSLVAVGFLCITIVISPVFLEPLLNHFTPLAPGPLREQILSMARANGIPAHDVYEFDNSRQTNRMSAHVSGLFGTTQISLNDNLVKQGTPDEVLAVLGHEMGHYVMNHVLNFVLQLALIFAGGFAFARWGFDRVASRFGARWRLQGVADPAGLPLLAAAFTLYLFLLTPVVNSLIRAQEMQADLFGLNLARRPDAFATAALKLSTYRKLDPSPLEEIIFYNHPSGHTRILTAMRWKAEMQH